MNEVIKKWQIFMAEWAKDTKNIVEVYGEKDKAEKFLAKPTFYDFMEWLSKQINL